MDKLANYRQKIDTIDKQVVKLLLLRLKLAKKIATYKKINKRKILDKKRETFVLISVRKHSDNKNKAFITKIFKYILNYSRRVQLR